LFVDYRIHDAKGSLLTLLKTKQRVRTPLSDIIPGLRLLFLNPNRPVSSEGRIENQTLILLGLESVEKPCPLGKTLPQLEKSCHGRTVYTEKRMFRENASTKQRVGKASAETPSNTNQIL
jgi:hypothetical protein